MLIRKATFSNMGVLVSFQKMTKDYDRFIVLVDTACNLSASTSLSLTLEKQGYETLIGTEKKNLINLFK